jgi:hypothetical protein
MTPVSRTPNGSAGAFSICNFTNRRIKDEKDLYSDGVHTGNAGVTVTIVAGHYPLFSRDAEKPEFPVMSPLRP